MTYARYILLMFVGTVIAFSVWLWVLLFINPDTTGPIGIFLFYISLILSLMGLLALIGLFVRLLGKRSERMRFYAVRTSFRQAVLLTLLIIVVLTLEHFKMLSWWNFGLMLLFIISLEFFYSAGNHIKT